MNIIDLETMKNNFTFFGPSTFFLNNILGYKLEKRCFRNSKLASVGNNL